jgi:hypothetical protein
MADQVALARNVAAIANVAKQLVTPPVAEQVPIPRFDYDEYEPKFSGSRTA